MSAPTADPQFQHRTIGLSNLDRCNRCSLYRAAHGPDWSCPAGPSPGVRVFLLAAGALLAVGGAVLWGLSSSAPSALNTLTAVAFPGGLALIVSALMITGWRERPGGKITLDERSAESLMADLADLVEAEYCKALEERRRGG